MPRGKKKEMKVIGKIKTTKRKVVETFQESVPVEPTQASDCKGCSHPENKHYGNAARWCNTPDCRCAAFQK